MTQERPLSPHLQVYRLPLTAILSISHRITGVLLAAGLLAMSASLLAIAALGPAAWDPLRAIYASLPGQLAVWLYVCALCFHTCHGIRHLLWDAGHRLDRSRQFRDNLIELLLSLALAGGLFAAAHGYIPACHSP